MNNTAIHYITPAVTPMLPDRTIDFASCENLYNHLINGGVDGILALGSIGEFYTFTMEQKKEFISFAAKTVAKRVPLIVGTTSMIMDEIIELSNYALDNGADAVMIIPPFYFYHTDETVFAYYDELAEAIHGDVYLYNFPDRTGYEISPKVVRMLAEKRSNIVGIKDTIGGLDHTRELIKQVREVRPDFVVYSGFDDNFAHNVLCGGNGCIAGLSNLYPELTSSWVKAMKEKDMDKAQEVQQAIDKLMDIYGVGKPFIPYIKQALLMKGVIAHGTMGKPAPEVTPEQVQKIQDILNAYENK